MFEMIEFLSSGIPGGIVVLFLVLLSVNLTVWFFKLSKLIGSLNAIKKSVRLSAIIIFVYIILWFSLRPPLPQVRIVVLPSAENGRITLTASSFELPQKLQELASNNLTRRFIFHQWEWLLQTMEQDSLLSLKRWKKAGLALKPEILIESDRKNDRWVCTVYSISGSDVEKKSLTIPFSGSAIFGELNDEYDIFENLYTAGEKKSPAQLQSKIEIVLNHLDKAQRVIENDASLYAQLLTAEILLKKGLKSKIDREKAKYISVKNSALEKAKSILHQLRKERFAPAKVAYLLGRVAWREEDFNNVDIYLKTALSFEPANPRIHYGLSFLRVERYQELGYENRIEILKKAVYLDPGYQKAVFELADRYYNSGTGTQTGMGTTFAMQTIEKFLEISHGDGAILSLLGSIYLKIQKLDEALLVFQDLQKRYPNDSNMQYNIGVAYFYKKEYPQSLEHFNKAIEMDGNLDSFLYIGLINRKMGNNQEALKYFRERVQRKTGDDDRYAKEAMTGIRIILKKMEEQNPGQNK